MAPSLSLGVGLTGVAALSKGGGYDLYVNSLIGDDGNPGTFSQPKATIAAALASNKRIGLVRNGLWREQIDLSTYSGVTIGAYGIGDNPRVFGSIEHTSGWTNISGDVWEKDIGYTAVNAYTLDGSTVTKLTSGTYGALTDGQFGTSTNVLQVRVGAGIDPNDLTIEVPENGTLATATGIYSLGDANLVRDIVSWFWGQNGIEVAGGDGFSALSIDISYNSNDGGGVRGSSTTNVMFGECLIRRNGQVRGVTAAAPGDGISFHDNSTGTIRGCTITDNEKESIGNQPGTSVVVEFNYMRNNWLEYQVLGTSGTAKGEHDFRYNVVVWVPSGQGSGLAAVGVAASTNRPNVRVYNNTVYCDGAAGSGQCGLRVGGGDVIAKNNIIKGFNRGIDHRSTDTNASLVNDHNCMHGNTTNYFNNGTPGVSAGANDITSDPLLANAGSGDFTLQSGSPCRGAGVDVGLTTDKAGNSVTDPPDIGAFQYAA